MASGVEPRRRALDAASGRVRTQKMAFTWRAQPQPEPVLQTQCIPLCCLNAAPRNPAGMIDVQTGPDPAGGGGAPIAGTHVTGLTPGGSVARIWKKVSLFVQKISYAQAKR